MSESHEASRAPNPNGEQSTVRSSSTGSEDVDSNWDDWVEDEPIGPVATSLFDGHPFPTAQAALSYDKDKFNFDLLSLSTVLGSWRLQ